MAGLAGACGATDQYVNKPNVASWENAISVVIIDSALAWQRRTLDKVPILAIW